MIRFFSFLLVITLSQRIVGQDLIESRKESPVTKVFRLTSSETEKIYRKGISTVDSTFFHTLEYQHSKTRSELPYGNYLEVFSKGDDLHFELIEVKNVSIDFVGDELRQKIVIQDLEGNPLSEVRAKMKNSGLRFRKNQNLHKFRNIPKRGFVHVEHEGVDNFFAVTRSFNGSFLNRTKRRLLHGTPIKYTWYPFRDIYRTIARGYPHGFISQSINLFNGDLDHSSKYRGFMSFNQPKFRPGDTVRFKAFITKKNGRPINRELDLRINRYGESKSLGSIEPYRKGGYEGIIVLNDSLDFKLDNHLYVTLEKKKYKDVISRSFRFEDYELKEVNFEIRSINTEISGKEPLELYLQGKDANNLNLLDAEAEVFITSRVVKDFKESVIVPDTLWHKKINLEPVGETKLVIPSTSFPNAELDFQVSTYMTTSDGQIDMRSLEGSYHPSHEQIVFEIHADTVMISLKFNEEERSGTGVLTAFNSDRDTLWSDSINLPFQSTVNPTIASYGVTSGETTDFFQVIEESSKLYHQGYRTTDSVYFSINNPRNISFWYSIFHANKEIHSGYGKSLNFSEKLRSSKTYELQYSYMWGGSMQSESYRIPYFKDLINFNVNQPGRVFPGQTVDIQIVALDQDNKPICDVDVTSFAYTTKFKNSSSDDVPYLGKVPRAKRSYSSYWKSNIQNEAQNLERLSKWKKELGLDSIEYYKFILPEKKPYFISTPAPDSITQFAPFYFKDGEWQSIKVVYLNDVPIYFSGSSGWSPYSFTVDSGRTYQVKLRLANEIISIKKLQFEHGKKTFLSISDKTIDSNISRSPANFQFTDAEKRRLRKYLGYVENTFDQNWVILRQGKKIQLLNSDTRGYNSRRRFLVGPFNPANIWMESVDHYDHWVAFSPGFSTQYFAKLIREREIEITELNQYLFSKTAMPAIGDFIKTRNRIIEEWEEQKRVAALRERLNNPRSTEVGKGEIRIKLPDSLQNFRAEFLLVSNYANPNFLRIYFGLPSSVHNLEPGTYRVQGLTENLPSVLKDSIQVEKNSTTYTYYDSTDSLEVDLIELIEKAYASYPEDKEAGPNRIRESYHSQLNMSFSGYGEKVSGQVTDDTGEGLPGVNVVIKGTTIGVITDLDGYYSISVPVGSVLVFSFIGMSTQELAVGSQSNINLSMEADVQQLQEVVVVGYASRFKRELTGSVATIQTRVPMQSFDRALQGRAAGVQINTGKPGSAFDIRIRGVGSINSKNQPLLVLDGVIVPIDRLNDIDPARLKNIEIIKDAAATALYGSRASNGVIMISSADLKPDAQKAFTEEVLFSQSTGNSIRSNFRDYAWWEPSLRTDQNGVAKFSVTFPDDVTSWKIFVKGINEKKQSGEWEGAIQSFKEVMATLSVPRFLVEGDSTHLIGKVLNYTPDSLKIETYFENGLTKQNLGARYVTTSLIDTLIVSSSGMDSVVAKYQIKHPSGFSDGEQRTIPVYKKGLEVASGDFFVIGSDTSFRVQSNHDLGPIEINIQSSLTQVLKDELEYLINYPYECNEQLASKLIALLLRKQLDDSTKQKFKHENEIDRIIKKLVKNQSEDGLWGWWGSRNGALWITEHVVTALTLAEKLGFSSTWNKNDLIGNLEWLYPTLRIDEKLLALTTLQELEDPRVESRLKMLENEIETLNHFLHHEYLKSEVNLNVDLDSVLSRKKETALGSWSWSDSLAQNDLENTLWAYKILKQTGSDSDLRKIQVYIASKRKIGFWVNTYQSSRVLLALKDELYAMVNANSEVSVNGKKITEFPYSSTYDEPPSITKTGSEQVYFSYHQDDWISNPDVKSDFAIVKTIMSQSSQTLKTGKAETLVCSLNVTKEAEYIMLSVPIPAGCSYQSKSVNYRLEEHREYYKDRVNIYVRKLNAGVHQFNIDLLPRFSGVYTLNPAKAELMYAPVISSNNSIKSLTIEEW